MYEQINENIEVFVDFKKSDIVPKSFVWRNKLYQVDKVNLIHTSKIGSQTVYHFSLSNHDNYFQLAFNPYTLTWTLEVLYYNS